MSTRHLNHVFDRAATDGPDFTLLVTIAYFADDDGVCTRTISQLAEFARMSCGMAVNRLLELHEFGFIDVESAFGRYGPCRIAIPLKGDGYRGVSVAGLVGERDEPEESQEEIDAIAFLFD